MIAAANATVAEHNDRARTSRVDAGQVADTGVELRDGRITGVGDLVITPENQRRVRTIDGNWVRNGDTWRVTATHADGSITVMSSRDERDAGRGDTIRLDPDYVAANVQLGYAVTAHRAQGATVDTCHVVATPAMTREAFYVAPRSDWGHWKALLAAAGVRDARLHDPRHTAATLLLVQGVNARTVMDVTGWTEARMLSRYQHVVDELRRDTADRMGKALWPGSAGFRGSLRSHLNQRTN